MEQQKGKKATITTRTTTTIKTRRFPALVVTTFAAIALLVIATPLAMISSVATPAYGKGVIVGALPEADPKIKMKMVLYQRRNSNWSCKDYRRCCNI